MGKTRQGRAAAQIHSIDRHGISHKTAWDRRRLRSLPVDKGRDELVRGLLSRAVRAYFVLVGNGSDFMALDPTMLNAALAAGGALVADATVKEITKDTYQALKRKVCDLFGRRAAKATDKLETLGSEEEGKAELAIAIPDLQPDEADEIRPILQAFLDTMREDDRARAGIAHARIALDLDAGGNVLIDNVEHAREIAIRSRSDGDFTFSNVKMDPGSRSGN